MFLYVFFWLLVGHALADYPWQGDFLSKAKNHQAPIPGVPWQHALFWHAMIHAGVVAWVIHGVNPDAAVTLGLCELVVHVIIDWMKCDGRTTFNVDQWLHVGCKVIWAFMAVWTVR